MTTGTTTWIALLRGVNVGGRNKLLMQALREAMERAGFANARTYIQSGNCVFDAETNDPAAVAAEVSALIQREFGFEPRIVALTREQLEAAIAANPYREAGEADGKSVHFYFLSAPAKSADLGALQALAAANEAFTLTERVFYLHAPDGIGRLKLAEKVEAKLGVLATARNFGSVQAIAALATGEN